MRKSKMSCLIDEQIRKDGKKRKLRVFFITKTD